MIAPMRRPAVDVIAIAALAAVVGLLPLPGDDDLLLPLFLCGLVSIFLNRLRGGREVEKGVLAAWPFSTIRSRPSDLAAGRSGAS